LWNPFKKARFLMSQKKLNTKPASGQQDSSTPPLTPSLNKNLETIKNIVGTSEDIIIRKFTIGTDSHTHAAIIFVDGLADKAIISKGIIKPLMYDTYLIDNDDFPPLNINFIKQALVAIGDVKESKTIEEIIAALLYGNTILLVDGFTLALDIDTKGWNTRSIEEPKIEQSVRGPREGFTETLRTNTALLRRKIKNPDFTLEHMVIGNTTHTLICLAYIKGLTHPDLIEEVKRRLKLINTDAILESGYIEEFIEDAPFSPFATIGNSEKPDRVAARILEGRVALLVDGTPFALTMPMLFAEGFQATEDYYSRPYYASFLRLLRIISFFITLLAPAFYVALESYSPEILPTPLLITMAAASEGTPFPAVLETIIIGFIFEILREGGIRLPTPIGPALSIVGALIIGDAAVSAGLIGAPLVIIVAITAVSSFMVIPHADAIALLRFLLIIMAGILGFFGIGICLLGLLVHICSLRSFGVPYTAPSAPLSWTYLQDIFIRAPLRVLQTRRINIYNLDPERQAFRLDLKTANKKES
jgi:spore germination protein KA